jgi:serine/threonine protein kinase
VITETLKFRLPDGTETIAEVELEEAPLPAGEFLVARTASLAGDVQKKMRQHRAVGGRRREDGLERLDNEIMVGRRLAGAVGRGGYPAEVACLCGDDADGADPYALFEEYRGKPLREAWKSMKEAELKAFPASLLRGLCWLAAVGVAHRGIGPDTVWWDGRRALITDFSTSTVFGAARARVRGSEAWVPEEQRNGTGWAGPRDDTWAAAQLIFHVQTKGQECDPEEDNVTAKLVSSGLDEALARALAWAFRSAADRATASELLAYLGSRDPSPAGFTAGASLLEGRGKFTAARGLKHSQDVVPVWEPTGLNEDLQWALAGGSTPPPAVPAVAERPAAGPPVFAVSPHGEPPDTGGSNPGTTAGPQAVPPEPAQPSAGRKRLFGRKRGQK